MGPPRARRRGLWRARQACASPSPPRPPLGHTGFLPWALHRYRGSCPPQASPLQGYLLFLAVPHPGPASVTGVILPAQAGAPQGDARHGERSGLGGGRRAPREVLEQLQEGGQHPHQGASTRPSPPATGPGGMRQARGQGAPATQHSAHAAIPGSAPPAGPRRARRRGPPAARQAGSSRERETAEEAAGKGGGGGGEAGERRQESYWGGNFTQPALLSEQPQKEPAGSASRPLTPSQSSRAGKGPRMAPAPSGHPGRPHRPRQPCQCPRRSPGHCQATGTLCHCFGHAGLPL